MDVDLQDRRQSHEQAGTSNGSAPMHVTTQGGVSVTPQQASAHPASPQAEPDFYGHTHNPQPSAMHSDVQSPGPCATDLHNADPAARGTLNGYNPQHSSAKRDSAQRDTAQHDPGPLPMLASACPGWVCYAEKTHGSYILPYISTTKSPQVSCSASLVQDLLARSR